MNEGLLGMNGILTNREMPHCINITGEKLTQHSEWGIMNVGMKTYTMLENGHK